MGIVSVTDVCNYLGNGLHPSVSVPSRVGEVLVLCYDCGWSLLTTYMHKK